jgi:DNA-binding response OmpR family regulator
MTASVLVVEDERKIRDLLRSYLEHDGLTVITTGSGAEAIQLARNTAPDLIVLDLSLPDVPGEEVAREVRAAAATPIMMLTAKTDTTDRIHGLELFADDYVTKPFRPPGDRPARPRHLAPRRHHRGPGRPVSHGGGQLIIDEAGRQVTAAGHIVGLTATEWKLLTTLASVPGRVYSRCELINRIRGYEYDGYDRTIDSHIRNLRQKIETDSHAPRLVETVTGAGYRLAITRDHQPAAAAPGSPGAERDNPRPG